MEAPWQVAAATSPQKGRWYDSGGGGGGGACAAAEESYGSRKQRERD